MPRPDSACVLLVVLEVGQDPRDIPVLVLVILKALWQGEDLGAFPSTSQGWHCWGHLGPAMWVSSRLICLFYQSEPINMYDSQILERSQVHSDF